MFSVDQHFLRRLFSQCCFSLRVDEDEDDLEEEHVTKVRPCPGNSAVMGAESRALHPQGPCDSPFICFPFLLLKGSSLLSGAPQARTMVPRCSPGRWGWAPGMRLGSGAPGRQGAASWAEAMLSPPWGWREGETGQSRNAPPLAPPWSVPRVCVCVCVICMECLSVGVGGTSLI